MYIPCTTCLHIPVYIIIKSTVYCPAHYFIAHVILYFILLYFLFLLNFFPYLYLCIFSWVCISYNCTVHGADLTYISLLVIFCIIVYVTNKKNLEQISRCHPHWREQMFRRICKCVACFLLNSKINGEKASDHSDVDIWTSSEIYQHNINR